MLKVFGVGMLGRDAELRFTPNGDANLQWTMAFNTGFGDNKKTTWVRATLWGARAEKLQEYFLKGTKLAVTGTLEAREYQAQDGTTRTSLDLRVDDFSFASAKADNGGATEKVAVAAEDDDEVPF